MRASLSNLTFAVCVTGPLLMGHGASAETLKLAGTGGAMPMAERVAAEFFSSTGIKVDVIPGLGQQRRHRCYR